MDDRFRTNTNFKMISQFNCSLKKYCQVVWTITDFSLILPTKTNKMLGKKKPLPLLESILITGVIAGGKSLARMDDIVVFVSFAVSGDVVDLQMRKKRHHCCEAEMVCLVKYSNVRQAPKYQHPGICDGYK